MKALFIYFLLCTAALAQSISITNPAVRVLVKTVAGLPAYGASTQGAIYLVTDALIPAALATVSGGGAVIVPVICNGTNWIVG